MIYLKLTTTTRTKKKKTNLFCRTYYPVRLSFRSRAEMKSISDKQELKEFIDIGLILI